MLDGVLSHIRNVSLSSWRAWIEIVGELKQLGKEGRSPHGERGLKYNPIALASCISRRSPHGERGLKSIGKIGHGHEILSLSSWRAWIEIRPLRTARHGNRVALLMESVD